MEIELEKKLSSLALEQGSREEHEVMVKEMEQMKLDNARQKEAEEQIRENKVPDGSATQSNNLQDHLPFTEIGNEQSKEGSTVALEKFPLYHETESFQRTVLEEYIHQKRTALVVKSIENVQEIRREGNRFLSKIKRSLSFRKNRKQSKKEICEKKAAAVASGSVSAMCKDLSEIESNDALNVVCVKQTNNTAKVQVGTVSEDISSEEDNLNESEQVSDSISSSSASYGIESVSPVEDASDNESLFSAKASSYEDYDSPYEVLDSTGESDFESECIQHFLNSHKSMDQLHFPQQFSSCQNGSIYSFDAISNYEDLSADSSSIFKDCYESLTDLVLDDSGYALYQYRPPSGGSGRGQRRRVRRVSAGGESVTSRTSTSSVVILEPETIGESAKGTTTENEPNRGNAKRRRRSVSRSSHRGSSPPVSISRERSVAGSVEVPGMKRKARVGRISESAASVSSRTSRTSLRAAERATMEGKSRLVSDDRNAPPKGTRRSSRIRSVSRSSVQDSCVKESLEGSEAKDKNAPITGQRRSSRIRSASHSSRHEISPRASTSENPFIEFPGEKRKPRPRRLSARAASITSIPSKTPGDAEGTASSGASSGVCKSKTSPQKGTQRSQREGVSSSSLHGTSPPEGITDDPVGEVPSSKRQRVHTSEHEESAMDRSGGRNISQSFMRHLEHYRKYFPEMEVRSLTQLEKYQANNYVARFAIDSKFFIECARSLGCKDAIIELKGEDLKVAQTQLAHRLVIHEGAKRVMENPNETFTELQSVAGSEDTVMTLRSDMFPTSRSIGGISYKGKSYEVNVGLYKEMKGLVTLCTLTSENFGSLITKPEWRGEHKSLCALLETIGIKTLLEAKTFLTYCKGRALEILTESQHAGSSQKAAVQAKGYVTPGHAPVPSVCSQASTVSATRCEDQTIEITYPEVEIVTPSHPVAHSDSSDRQEAMQKTSTQDEAPHVRKPAHWMKLSRTRSYESPKPMQSTPKTVPVAQESRPEVGKERGDSGSTSIKSTEPLTVQGSDHAAVALDLSQRSSGTEDASAKLCSQSGKGIIPKQPTPPPTEPLPATKEKLTDYIPPTPKCDISPIPSLERNPSLSLVMDRTADSTCPRPQMDISPITPSSLNLHMTATDDENADSTYQQRNAMMSPITPIAAVDNKEPSTGNKNLPTEKDLQADVAEVGSQDGAPCPAAKELQNLTPCQGKKEESKIVSVTKGLTKLSRRGSMRLKELASQMKQRSQTTKQGLELAEDASVAITMEESAMEGDSSVGVDPVLSPVPRKVLEEAKGSQPKEVLGSPNTSGGEKSPGCLEGLGERDKKLTKRDDLQAVCNPGQASAEGPQGTDLESQRLSKSTSESPETVSGFSNQLSGGEYSVDNDESSIGTDESKTSDTTDSRTADSPGKEGSPLKPECEVATTRKRLSGPKLKFIKRDTVSLTPIKEVSESKIESETEMTQGTESQASLDARFLTSSDESKQLSGDDGSNSPAQPVESVSHEKISHESRKQSPSAALQSSPVGLESEKGFGLKYRTLKGLQMKSSDSDVEKEGKSPLRRPVLSSKELIKGADGNSQAASESLESREEGSAEKRTLTLRDLMKKKRKTSNSPHSSEGEKSGQGLPNKNLTKGKERSRSRDTKRETSTGTVRNVSADSGPNVQDEEMDTEDADDVNVTFGAMSADVKRVLGVKQKIQNKPSEVTLARHVEDMSLAVDMTEELAKQICESQGQFRNNGLQDYMLPTDANAMYVYRINPTNVDGKGSEGIIYKLGQLDPYRWRSEGTKAPKDKEGKYILKRSNYVARKGVGKEIVLIQNVKKKIYSLADNYYVVQFIGNLNLAELDTRSSWFHDLEEEADDVSTENSHSSDSDSSDLHEIVEPQPFAKSTETREATPSYMENYERLGPNVIEQLLNPRLSPEVTPCNAITDVVTRTDVGLIYVFDVSKLRTNWTKTVLKDGLGWWKVSENLGGGRSYGELTYYIYNSDERKTNCGYRRKVYFNTQTKRVVIHYRGNQELRAWQAHGNSRNKNVPFIRTSDHAKQAIWDKGLSIPPVQLLHETQAQKHGGLLGAITCPSTLSKVLYERKKMRSNVVADSHDLNVLKAVQDDNRDLVRQTMIGPNFGITCMTQEAIDHMAVIIANYPRGRNAPPLLFQYDTTFNTGSNYFSVLSISHPLLMRRGAVPNNSRDGAPQVPIAVHIHEKKLVVDHRNFFARIRQCLNERTRDAFEDVPKALICDQEFGEETWNQMGPVHYCWNHLLKNVKRQLEKIRLSPEEVKQAMGAVQGMLRSTSLRSYEAKLQRYPNEERTARAFSNEAFMRYFMERVDRKIRDHSGRWLLQANNIENAVDGVTTNAAEGLNRRIKEHKQALRLLGMTVNYTYQDSVVIARSLLDSYDTICTQAMYGQGDLTLRPTYVKLQRPIEEAPAVNKKTMMEVLQEIRDKVGGPRHKLPDAEMESEDEMATYTQTQRTQSTAKQGAEPIFDDEEEPTGIASLAKYYVDKKRVGVISNGNVRGYFVCETNGVIRSVQLDLQHCSCLEKGFCAHYIAALYEAKVISSFNIQAIKKQGIRQPSHAIVPRGHESRSSKRPKKRDHITDDEPIFRQDTTEGETSKLQKTGNTTDFDYGIHRDNKPGMTFPHKKATFKLGSTSTPKPKRKGKMVSDDDTEGTDKDIEETEEQKKRRFSKTMARLTDAQQLNLVAKHEETLRDRCPVEEFDGNWSVQLNVGDSKILQIGGYNYGVICQTINTVAVVKDLQSTMSTDDSMLRFGARCVSHLQDKRNEIFVKSFITDDVGKITEALKKGYDQKKLGLYKTASYRLICYCREPKETKKIKENTWNCKKCKETFHYDCTGVTPKSKIPKQCGKCTLPKGFKGFRWAAGQATNTCTIDNELTAIVLRAKESAQFLRAVCEYDYNNDEISASIHSCVVNGLSGRWGNAQNAWNEVRLLHAEQSDEALPLDPADLYGNPHRMFFKPLYASNAGALEYTLSCIECGRESTELVSDFATTNCSLPLHRLVTQSIMNPPVHFKSPKCSSKDCRNAQKVVSQVSPRNSWFWHLNLENTPYTAREVLQIPTRVVIGGHSFQLAVVTFNRSGTHFNAMLFHDNTFLSYDGQRSSGITLPEPTEYAISMVDRTISGITYHREFKDEENAETEEDEEESDDEKEEKEERVMGYTAWERAL